MDFSEPAYLYILASMYATNGPTDYKHDAGALVLTIIFFYFARSMYLQ